jgi:hypothetical protein
VANGWHPNQDLETQVAVLATEVKNLKEELNDLHRALRGVQVGLWAFVVSLVTVAATLLAGHVH